MAAAAKGSQKREREEDEVVVEEEDATKRGRSDAGAVDYAWKACLFVNVVYFALRLRDNKRLSELRGRALSFESADEFVDLRRELFDILDDETKRANPDDAVLDVLFFGPSMGTQLDDEDWAYMCAKWHLRALDLIKECAFETIRELELIYKGLCETDKLLKTEIETEESA